MKISKLFPLSLAAGLIGSLSLASAHGGELPNEVAEATAVTDFDDGDPKILRMPMRTSGPGSMDPQGGSTTYDNRACSLVYEGLLQYKYLKRPYELEPLLLAKMPTTTDGLTYDFELKQGVLFHDDPCFPGGVGRELVSDDVFYSLKRIGDNKVGGKNVWLIEETVVGYDAFVEAQNKAVSAGGKYDYSQSIAGFKRIDDHRFQIILSRPVSRFLWTLPMFQFSIGPHEACEKYGSAFARHAVGTGPYTLAVEDWKTDQSMVFKRNKKYRQDFYPTEWNPEDEAMGFHKPAGQQIPIIDRVEVTMFVQDNPMWLEFNAGKLDYTQVPAENFQAVYSKRSRKLKKEFKKKGIISHAVPLLDFIFRGFNMEDPVVGGYTKDKIALRRAMSYAVNMREFNSSFYNNENLVYDGMIPPGIAGHPQGGRAEVSFRGPDLEKAKALMVEAGYPGGKGLDEITYYIASSGNAEEQAEMLKRQLGQIGVRLKVRAQNFAQLIDAINSKKAQIFSFAWSTDYPDAENNLALFYGPNVSPGANHFNYSSKAFDKLYEQIQVMEPSDERTVLIVRARDMVVSDMAYLGSMARTRKYLVSPWLKNFKPDETFYNWVKYLDIDESKRN